MAAVFALLVAGLLVASANGANDTSKGVATLVGSGSASYWGAILWGLSWTTAGGLLSAGVAQVLARRFAGAGLVPDQLVGDPELLVAVGFGAGLVVCLASLQGWPVSTTHALLGGLLGAALAHGARPDSAALVGQFLVPLALSPLVASGAVMVLNRLVSEPLAGFSRTCVCIDRVERTHPMDDGAAAVARARVSVVWANNRVCTARGLATVFRMRVSGKALHLLSAAAVSLARGMNDTPKIAALLLAVPLTNAAPIAFAVATGAMLIGGLVGAWPVARRMSYEITPMNGTQGFIANVATSTIVLGASWLGLPVSTTHVSCGALFGIAASRPDARRRTIAAIVLAWLVTLPLAATGAAAIVLALP